MKYTLFLSILFACFALLSTMKRKKVDNHNENRKLKRRVAALLKKELAIGKAEYAKLMRARDRKSNSRLNKFRKSIKKR